MKPEKDICQNRHRGNPESEAVFEYIASKLPARRQKVLLLIHKAGFKGLTVHEASKLLETTPNAISGRFSELKRDGLIVKRGTRPTETGSNAGVFVGFEKVSPPAPGPAPDYWFDLFNHLYTESK